MLKGHNIICFSCDWDQDPLSKHHIMSRLAKQNRILWINSIGMRTPTLAKKDISRIGNKLKSFFKSVREVQKNLYVISPLVIPFHSNVIAAKINKLLLILQIRYYQQKLNMKNPVLCSFAPNAESAFGNLNEKLSLYYITDDFTQFTGHPAKSIADMESRLIDKCDIVIASAKTLAAKKTRNGKNISVISHGVNYEHFAAALNSQKNPPSDIKAVRHPIIGFYGELNDWLDLRMVATAAKMKPEWSWVFIGRVAVEVGDIGYLRDMKNVHFLGQKKFAELPDYCAHFDAALIPMKVNELTLSVNPLKLREYLAAGLPVVSAPLPEVFPYRDVVRFARTPDELIAEIDYFLKQDRKKLALIMNRRVADESWDGKIEEISAIIEKSLKQKKDGMGRL